MDKLDSQFRIAMILLAGGFIVGGGVGLLASVGAGAAISAGLIEGSKNIKPIQSNVLIYCLI